MALVDHCGMSYNAMVPNDFITLSTIHVSNPIRILYVSFMDVVLSQSRKVEGRCEL